MRETPKFATVRTENPHLVAMTDDEFQLFLCDAMSAEYQKRFGSFNAADGIMYWLVGNRKQVERARVQYNHNYAPCYYIEYDPDDPDD